MRSPTVNPARRAGQGGFSLIELLVAVLVMGIGVLGVSALQMVSLQNNRMALERGEAVHLAYDIMDRIRANPGVDYQIGIGDGPPGAPDCVGNGSNCSAAQMVAFDQAVWKCMLGEYEDDAECAALRADDVLPDTDLLPGLPEGDGSVVNNGGFITVTVQWTGMDGANQSVVIESQQ